MFDIGWGEMLVIGVVALIAIGPKELPGVLRMVGQWVGKARRMASEFQGQFNEAMREAEMADLKQSLDEISAAAKGLSGGNILSSVTSDVQNALKIDPPVTRPTTTEPAAPESVAPSNGAVVSESAVLAENQTSEVAHTSETVPPMMPQGPPESGKAP